MGGTYERMKDEAGLRGVLEGESDSDGATEEAYKELRPKSKYSYKDFAQRKDDILVKKLQRQSQRVLQA